jgi:hypothetical protein
MQAAADEGDTVSAVGLSSSYDDLVRFGPDDRASHHRSAVILCRPDPLSIQPEGPGVIAIGTGGPRGVAKRLPVFALDPLKDLVGARPPPAPTISLLRERDLPK